MLNERSTMFGSIGFSSYGAPLGSMKAGTLRAITSSSQIAWSERVPQLPWPTSSYEITEVHGCFDEPPKADLHHL